MSITDIVEETAFNLIRKAVTTVPKDVESALRKALAREEGVAKTQLEAIIRNIETARKTSRPLCQDTGLLTFFVESGSGLVDLCGIAEALKRATVRATNEVPLRPNAVDPLSNINSGNNTGRHIPIIEWEASSGEALKITVLPKGGGSENVTKLYLLKPAEGWSGILRVVLNSILEAGPYPCPPTIVGVGVGGSSELALKLSKRALLRPLNIKNPNPKLAKYEDQLYEAANSLGIGPMGLGGKTTVLGVKIEYAYRHPASLPVAVSYQCWAARRATAIISPDGSVKYID